MLMLDKLIEHEDPKMQYSRRKFYLKEHLLYFVGSFKKFYLVLITGICVYVSGRLLILCNLYDIMDFGS